MSLSNSDENNRLENAQQRLTAALNRVEIVLANISPDKISLSEENSTKLEKLEIEVKSLRCSNASLQDASKSALKKVDATIHRLKSILGA